ncbi:MAG: hypothetical protein PHQ74_10460 [Crocinitomicaceae bacterium]|nr:hypothetical protein [Crocinitomicaceae bacterium]
MKKFILLLIPFFFSAILLANPGKLNAFNDTLIVKNKVTIKNTQGVVVETYQLKKGEKHGARRVFNNQAGLVLMEQYKKGKLDGTKTTYDYSGKIQSIEKYSYFPTEQKSLLDGKQQKFSNGILISEITFKKNLKVGPYQYFYNDGKIKERGTLEGELKTGKFQAYDSKGQLTRDENYVIIRVEEVQVKKERNLSPNKIEIKKEIQRDVTRSVLDGTCTYYYNGLLQKEANYKLGKLEGLVTEFYVQPQYLLKSKENYKDNLRFGSFIFYQTDGKVEKRGKYYQEIKVDDQVLKNVYDGENVYYNRNGFIERIENWKNYQRQGTWQWFNQNGIQTHQVDYDKGLKVGKEIYWDNQGNKTSEVTFVIQVENGISKSVSHGLQKGWKNGVLISETPYVNGLRQGLHKEFYPNGNLKEERNFVNDSLSGKYFNYYEDGTLQREYYYQSSKSGNQIIGWNKNFDKDGHLISAYYGDGLGNNLVSKTYGNEEMSSLSVKDLMQLALHPNGEIMSIQFASSYQYGFAFYSTGQLRKIYFYDASGKPVTANFTAQKELLQVISNNVIEEDETTNQTARAIAQQVNPSWGKHPFFTDSVKNGNYILNYSNGKPFLDLQFSNDLPEGKWLISDAVSSDTIFYANFKNGKKIGLMVRKKNYGIPMERKVYGENEELISSTTYHLNGNRNEERTYEKKNPVYTKEFYENGMVKRISDEINKNYFNFKNDGSVFYSTETFSSPDSIRIIKNYFEKSNQLKDLRKINFTLNTGIRETYYENGQLNFYTETDGKEKQEGVYKRYNEKGILLLSGAFKAGKKDGIWLTYDDEGKMLKQEDFKSGELIIDPENEEECACYDKTLSNSKLGFAQLASFFTSYKDIKNAIPKYIQPVDSFNFDKIFFINFQGMTDGFSSMKLLPAREFSFYTSSNKNLKVNLTPCNTSGYWNSIESRFTVSRGKLAYATLDLKRIAISLEKNPLTKLDGKPFKAYFDAKEIELRDGKLNLTFANSQNECLSTGLIQDFIKISNATGKPVINQLSFQQQYISWADLPVTSNEKENFNGIVIQKADIKLINEIVTDNLTSKHNLLGYLVGTSDLIIAGDNWVAGQLSFDGILKDGVFTQDLEKGSATIELKILIKKLEDRKLLRLTSTYLEDEKVLKINFFVEK